LLNCGDVDEHVLASVIANDEAEALLRVEEFDDALGLAHDLRRHSAGAAASKAATAATGAATEATASSAAAGAIAEAAAAEPAAVTKSAPAAVAAALLESAWFADCVFAETVSFIAAACAAVALAPSVETHARPNFRVPTIT
jgi:hypothetical protein